MFRTLLPALGLLCLLSLPARAADNASAKELLPGVKRLLFLGDSITYAGGYIDDFETALRLHEPRRQIEVIDCGLPSETVSGLSEEGHAGGKFPRPDLHERLDRVLAKVKPDLIIACYGMNDGIYLPAADDRFAAFKAGMTKLHQKAEAAGAKIIHLTAPVFDSLPIRARVVPADKADGNHPFEGYDQVLDRYGQWLLEQRKAGWQVIDLHGPMSAAVAEHRKSNPAFTFAKDGVHPDAAGHRVMADALLAGLDAKYKSSDLPTDIPNAKFVAERMAKLVHDRGRILADAWLTETGHKRPGMKQGLPLDDARQKSAKTEQLIAELWTER